MNEEQLDIPFTEYDVSSAEAEKLTTQEEEDLDALDALFAQTHAYRRSREYIELLDFIGRFSDYSPYNVALLHIQNPSAKYVATPKQWLKRFGRRVQPGARPLIILRPFGPVMFVYDIGDTEPLTDGVGELPEALADPFAVDGELDADTWRKTIDHCKRERIALVRDGQLSSLQAGSVARVTSHNAHRLPETEVRNFRYLVTLNSTHDRPRQYATLAHELGHLYCGHVGADSGAWWETRIHLPHRTRELEAESVAYLVCRRTGLQSLSEQYLVNYTTNDDLTIPDNLSLRTILDAVRYIEEMGRSGFRSKRKES